MVTQQLHQLEQGLTILTAKLDSEKARRESIDSQLKRLDDENSSIKNELQELNMQIETCDFGLRELEPKVEQANQAMAVQTVRIDEAVAKLKTQNDTYQALQIKLGTLTQAKPMPSVCLRWQNIVHHKLKRTLRQPKARSRNSVKSYQCLKRRLKLPKR